MSGECEKCGWHTLECICAETVEEELFLLLKQNNGWISPEDKFPPQGRKVLWFKNGDISVVQRFGNNWLPILFIDSKYATNEEPDYWKFIEMPNGYRGEMKVSINDEMINMDQFEEKYPEKFAEFMEDIVKKMVQKIEKNKQDKKING